MNIAKRVVVILSALCLCGCLDAITKRLAASFLSGGVTRTVLGDTVQLHLVYNQGGFLSFGASAPDTLQWLLSAWMLVVLLVVFAYGLFSRPGATATVVASAFVFAGGAANLADRVIHGGSVVDFLLINLPGLRGGIFNLADVTVVAGFLLLVAAKIRERRTAPHGRLEQAA